MRLSRWQIPPCQVLVVWPKVTPDLPLRTLNPSSQGYLAALKAPRAEGQPGSRAGRSAVRRKPGALGGSARAGAHSEALQASPGKLPTGVAITVAAVW